VNITELRLPNQIKRHLEKIGYKTLYPPQEEAIKAGLLEGRNLVISTPTASGKTLIAIILFLKRLAEEEEGKYIYLVPLKALANEKYQELMKHLDISLNGRKPIVAIATSDYDTSGEELKNADVIIATNEKMDSLLRHRPSWISKIKVVVVDEGHLIGSPDRGPILEILISRLKTEYPNIQFLILSATISNAEEYSKWINGYIIRSDWRPVPLREGVLYDHVIIYSDYTEKELVKHEKDPIIDMIINTLYDKGQIIIFTQTRSEAKRRAKRISYYLSKYLDDFYNEYEKEELMRLKRKILESGERTKLSEALADVVDKGVGFHHAGLSPTHRIILETAFRKGVIKVLTATPTLAAGVNLPSRVVLITYTTRRGVGGFQEDISVFEYKQMAGRAGRPQFDEYGEALLYSKHENFIDILIDNYILAEPEPLKSFLLEDEFPSVFILSIAASLRFLDDSKLHRYICNTLAYIQNDERRISRKVRKALNSLLEGELIQIVKRKSRIYYKPTNLGQRASELYILPSTATYLWKIVNSYKDMQKPLLLYHIVKTRDMPKLNLRKRDLKIIFRKIQEIGIEEEYVSNILDTPYIELYEEELATWKTTLVLYDWINEKTEDEILTVWKVEPGDLYALYSTAEWLAYSAKEIALIAENTNLHKEYSNLVLRLRYGVKDELIHLVALKGIGRRRARILYNNGYRTLKDIKKAKIEELVSLPGIGVNLAKQIIEEVKKVLG